MKRHFAIILLAGLVLGSSFLPAQALDIVVHPTGNVSFLPSGDAGYVLGENDEATTEDAQERAQALELRRKSEAALKEAMKQQRENTKPIRPTLTNKNTEIRVTTEGREAKTFLETKQASQSGKPKPPRVEEVQSSGAVRMQLPQTLKLPDSEKLREKSSSASQALRERSERRDEILELKSDINEQGEAQLELESREVRAKIMNSDVVVNPANNDVALASAPGQLRRRLNHLPDQAIERIKELIELKTSENGETPELELETKEDGSVVYTTNATRRKKLFGFINRDVETKVELNDETGEITETEIPPVSAWERFLLRFTR